MNALKSSGDGGCKGFRLHPNSSVFGWQTIRDLFDRELKRARESKMRRIKGLHRSFITRDAWTKMNVHAAKIIQSENVIAELKEQKAKLSPASPEFHQIEDTVLFLSGQFTLRN